MEFQSDVMWLQWTIKFKLILFLSQADITQERTPNQDTPLSLANTLQMQLSCSYFSA